jgi:uncharacterized protein
MPGAIGGSGNPFRYGHIATGEHFTNRTRELGALVSDLAGRQSVVIVSPRRYGKTSLALRARERLEQDQVLMAYADLFRATSKRRLIDGLGTALYSGLGNPLERARAAALDLFHALPLQPKISATRDGSPSIEFSRSLCPRIKTAD